MIIKSLYGVIIIKYSRVASISENLRQFLNYCAGNKIREHIKIDVEKWTARSQAK